MLLCVSVDPPLLQYYDIYAQFLRNTLEKLLLITFSWVIPNKSMVLCSTLLTLLIVSSQSTALTHHFRCLIGVANRPVTNRGRISWIIRNQTLDKLRLTFWPRQACWTVRKPAVGPQVLFTKTCLGNIISSTLKHLDKKQPRFPSSSCVMLEHPCLLR